MILCVWHEDDLMCHANCSFLYFTFISSTTCSALHPSVVLESITLISVFRVLRAITTTGWEHQGATFLLAGKIPRVNQSINAVPRTMSTKRCGAMSNKSRVHNLHRRKRRLIDPSSWGGYFLVVLSLGEMWQMKQCFLPDAMSDESSGIIAAFISIRLIVVHILLSVTP